MIIGATAATRYGSPVEDPPDTGTPPELGNVTLYTGTGAALSVTGVGLQPDLLIIKDRASGGWRWVDSERGLSNWMATNTFSVEDVDADGVTAVGTDGFTLGTSADFNTSGHAYAAFTLKQLAGAFDIVTYTGGVAAQIPHGLGVVPELIIIGNRWDTRNWLVYPGPLASAETKFLFANTTAAAATTSAFDSTAPTDTEFTVQLGSPNGNRGSDLYVAYCFASLTGKTKVGSYTGTGASGNAITTGFRPKWVLIKATSTTGDWFMVDEARDDTDPITASLSLNTTAAESTSAVSVTFSDTGFEPTAPNASGATYLYLAVA